MTPVGTQTLDFPTGLCFKFGPQHCADTGLLLALIYDFCFGALVPRRVLGRPALFCAGEPSLLGTHQLHLAWTQPT